MPLNLDLPLDGVTMHLRPSELDLVVAGFGAVDSSPEGHAVTLVDALRRLPPTDRAPTWELLVRHLGRHTPLLLAAGSIGMDLLHARDLLDALDEGIAAVPVPER